MTVQCGACGAENRDAAKFCKGCGRKIAQAWPQAAPVAAGVGVVAVPGVSAPAPRAAARKSANKAAEGARPAPAPPRARISNGRWIAALGLGVLMLVVAAAWWGHRNRSQEVESAVQVRDAAGTDKPPAEELPASTSTSTPASDASAPLPASPAPLEPSDKHEPAQLDRSATQADTKAHKPAARKQASPAPASTAAAAAPATSAPGPVRAPTPQESCAGRNFIARAQCLAEQCARPEVARHPQCEAVRQQQRIEEEKRNPTMAG